MTKPIANYKTGFLVLLSGGCAFLTYYFDISLSFIPPNVLIFLFIFVFPAVYIHDYRSKRAAVHVAEAPRSAVNYEHIKQEPFLTPQKLRSSLESASPCAATPHSTANYEPEKREPVPAPQMIRPPLEIASQMGVPAILLQPIHPQLQTSNNTSWFGGFPVLPEHISWPRVQHSANGTPLHFMAQIDCSSLPEEASRHNGFPRTGFLCFFSEMYEQVDVDTKVIHFEDDIRGLPFRSPPADSLPIWGDDNYSSPFDIGSETINRAGLPHPAAMPRVPVFPIQFMSYPSFGHLLGDQGSYASPRDWSSEKINETVRELQQLRRRSLLTATQTNVQANKENYESLVMMPAKAGQTDRHQYIGLTQLFIECLRDDAIRLGGYNSRAEQKLAFDALAQNARAFLSKLSGRPFFSTLHPPELDVLGALKDVWSKLQTKAALPNNYIHKAKQKMQVILFDGLINQTHGEFPEDVKRALLWLQAPVNLTPFPYEQDKGDLIERGIFQMGGYCHGSQHALETTAKESALLSIGYCELTGYAYGDCGDWVFSIPQEDLARKDFSKAYGYAQCH